MREAMESQQQRAPLAEPPLVHAVAPGSGRTWICIGALLGGLAVLTGAFAAHGLGDHLQSLYEHQTRPSLAGPIPAAQKYLQDFKTAAEYQMYHALALVGLGVGWGGLRLRPARLAGQCFLWGTVLFSGSLYVLVLTGITKLGMVTLFGGVLFVVGWGAFAYAAWARA